MKFLALSLLIVVVSGCAPTDPIDKLVEHLSAPDQGFPNGLWGATPLPSTASPTQVMATILGQGSIGVRTTNFTILEQRTVHVQPSKEASPTNADYTAVLVKTSVGEQIVMLQFQQHGTNAVWVFRSYDVK
ncbi:MAG TPA: hypothetical protein VFV96_12445 [Verrucomicrobiae bacterium]|nr:hypothetical protein [Verrucomicrobiae bacterium]